MSVAERTANDTVADDAAKRDCVTRILNSPLLQSSESLSSLLRYLAEHSIQSPDESLKEHQIATEVFHREASFDPRIDSLVRVHTSRLRSRLGEYYESGAGVHDPWQVQLPRGTHALVFVKRAPAAVPQSVVIPPQESGVSALGRRSVPVLFAVAIALLALAFWAGRLSGPDPTRSEAPPDVKAFWRLALRRPGPPLVVFSNAAFIGRPETGIRYLHPGEAVTSVYEGYTGVGEVFGVDALHNVLGSLGRTFELRRAQRLNWDEARDRDIIFLGSPSENLPVGQLQLEKHFAFRVSPGPERRGDLSIVNLQPQAGELPEYFASTQPITEDYAVVVLTQGISVSQSIVLLAGTTTYGTEAAAEFISKAESVSTLWGRMGRRSQPTSLSVLLHTIVKGGVPLETAIVALRVG